MASTAKDLPDANSPDLHLVVATDAELLQQQHDNSSAWKGALSLEAYLRREDTLLNQDLTRNGGLTPWVLVHGTGHERKVLCGCESLKKKALLAKNGQVEDVVCHAVASVFCPPKHRGNGYAGRMMAEVGKKLKRWQAEQCDCLFSVLYSDIGKKFYKARGWHPFPSAHVSLEASDAAPPDTLPKVRMLYAEDVPELCTIDEELLRQRMAKEKASSRYIVAIVPDIVILKWHFAREEFVSNELYHRQPASKGAMVGDQPGQRVWCYWTRVWTRPTEESSNTLHLLRLVIEDARSSDFNPVQHQPTSAVKENDATQAIAALFAAARAEAKKWDMASVEIWNPITTTLAAAQVLAPESAVVHRDAASIASLQWYGGGAEDPLGHVKWICNEKYAWC